MKKNTIIYHSLSPDGLIENAIRRLSEIILDYTGEYPICFPDDSAEAVKDARKIYLSVSPSLSSQEYRITVKDDTVYIEGGDTAGILYGCIDFYDKYLSAIEWTERSDPYIKNPLEAALPNFSLTSAPAIKSRGLWTWGHVIYDWRGYIDNMMLLKMNTLIMWNEFLPLNHREIIDYAHRAGIKVYFGFPWGWSTNCKNVDMTALDALSDSVVEYYEKNYAASGCDGIYFQSFTELSIDSISGVSIAEAVTDFVNKTAAKIFARYPSLDLQFGLHAMSVKTRLDCIARVDKRITIVWEDCGAFPYDYLPTKVSNFDETMELVRRITTLRGVDERFGSVLKGLTKLDWRYFEYPTGPYYIGVSSERKIKAFMDRKTDVWRMVEAGWMVNANYAYDAVKAIAADTSGDCCLTALVEDGVFERGIHYPVALLAEMLWDTEKVTADLVHSVALRDYITFEK